MALLQGFKNASDPLFKEKSRSINEEFDITNGINTLDTVRSMLPSKISFLLSHIKSAETTILNVKEVIDELNLFDTLSKDVK